MAPGAWLAYAVAVNTTRAPGFGCAGVAMSVIVRPAERTVLLAGAERFPAPSCAVGPLAWARPLELPQPASSARVAMIAIVSGPLGGALRVGTDGSDTATQAVREAVGMPRAVGATLELVGATRA